MTFTITNGRPQTKPVAGCDIIGRMRNQARIERDRLGNAPDSEIENFYVRLSSALDAQASERRAALDAVRAARAATGGAAFALARTAVKSGSDLFVVIAIQTRNPNLIGAAVGIDLVIDTADFVHQVIVAEDASQRQQAVHMLLADRTTMVQSLLSGPGRSFSQKHFETAKAFSDVMKEIGETVANEVRLKRRLAEAEQALEAIETQIADLPVNLQQTRQYMQDALDADIFVLGILQSSYSGNDCRIDGLPGPA